jgi:hypothetical protein
MEVEVFGKNCRWEFLIGKPLLKGLGVVHDYTTDIVVIRGGGHKRTLTNQSKCGQAIQGGLTSKTAPPLRAVNFLFDMVEQSTERTMPGISQMMMGVDTLTGDMHQSTMRNEREEWEMLSQVCSVIGDKTIYGVKTREEENTR